MENIEKSTTKVLKYTLIKWFQEMWIYHRIYSKDQIFYGE